MNCNWSAAYFLWNHRVHSGRFENRVPLMLVLWGKEGGGRGAYAATQIALLHMRRFNRTEYPIFSLSVFFVSKCNLLDFNHCENTPIKIYWTFHHQKLKNFRQKKKKMIFFIFLLKNIGCGYPSEPPRRGGSNEYPQSMFWTEIRKIMYILGNPSFTI